METHEHDASPQATSLTLRSDGQLCDHDGLVCTASSIEQCETLKIILDARTLSSDDRKGKTTEPEASLRFLAQSLHYELVEFLPQANGQCQLRYRRVEHPRP